MRRASTFISIPDTDCGRRAFCPSCESTKQTVTQRNRDGDVYSRCLTCARRFQAA